MPYHETQVRRRRELASILWGDSDLGLLEPGLDDTAERTVAKPVQRPNPSSAPAPVAGGRSSQPSPPASRFPAPQVPAPASPPSSEAVPVGAVGGWLNQRSVIRRSCSFPGLLRVMMPEVSFQPQVLAVRIVDISPRGAQVETRQLTPQLIEQIEREKRFARLEGLVPSREKLLLMGHVVWARHSPDLSRIGMEFDRTYAEIDEFFVADARALTPIPEPSIMTPVLDPFPTVTGAASYTFNGRADDADQIIARNGERVVEAKVEEGRFALPMPLAPNRTNFISFTAQRGKLASVPVPACLVHQVNAADSTDYVARSLVEEFSIDAANQRLHLRLHGASVKFQKAFKLLNELLSINAQIDLTLDVRGDVTRAARLLRALEKESGIRAHVVPSVDPAPGEDSTGSGKKSLAPKPDDTA